MGGRDARHPARHPTRHRTPRRARRGTTWLPVALVLVLLGCAVASWRFDLGERWFGLGGPDPSSDPAAVAPPTGVVLPALHSPHPVAEPASGGSDPARVRRAIAPLLEDPDLGKEVLATVTSLDGRLLYSSGTGAATPASTMKLLTTTAALETLGPDHTFETTVVSAGPRRIVLVGGGDPYLASRPPAAMTYPRRADVTTLAVATARSLKAAGHTRVRLEYDASLFSGPEVSPHWPETYVPEGVVSPISALWVDEGRAATGSGRVEDPSSAAATAFAAALAKAGIEVVGAPRPGRAPAAADRLAGVRSAPLSQIVERTLEVSDNEAAEVMLRHVALAGGGSGSFTSGTRGVVKVLKDLGVPTDGLQMYDGSGLSREDTVDPDTLAAVLRVDAAADRPELRAVVTGLPVAGFNGSLAGRFAGDDGPGPGMVRAKTGTLTGVSSLAGTVVDEDGNPMVFAVLADRIDPVDTLDARAALDGVTSALAGCHCAH